MSSGLFDSLTTGPIDLGQAEIRAPQADTLCVVAKANAHRCGLAGLCTLVATFTAWHTWRELQAVGTPGLWPGLAIVGVFASLILTLLFYERHTVFDASQRRAVICGRFLGLSRQFTRVLPERGRVRLRASIELARSDRHGVHALYTYHVDVADDAALVFESKGDRAAASAFVRRVADLLDYTVDVELDEEAVSGWRRVPLGDHAG